MTNLEKHMEEILNSKHPYCKAYEIRTGKSTCINEACAKCKKDSLKFLTQEYKEHIKLTQYEYDTLVFIKQNGYEWLARDRSKYNYTFENKPLKSDGYWVIGGMSTIVFNNLFPFIKWEDDEPYNIQELLDTCEVIK